MENKIEKDTNQIRARIEKLTDLETKKKPMNKLNSVVIGTEIVAGVLAGLIFGIFLDKLFASKPLFLIIGLIFGNIVSARIVWQKTKSK
ncbi:MAG: AtpZ/AtpI family protein [Janthinobacterium lividum]